MRVFFLGFMILTSSTLLAQSAYEGQMVSSVELVTSPTLDTGDLEHLVQQKRNTRYSDQQVRATIAALEGTGRFRDIHSDVLPDPNGLRVRFIMEPAYYYGLISFPEAVKKFSYTRLLQVVNLPDQEPYQEKGTATGVKSLLDFFHKNGYFDAQVNAETTLDSAHGLANIRYATELGRKAKIGNVQILATKPVEAEHIKGVIHSFRAKVTGAAVTSGKHYDPKRLDAATKLIRNNLAKRGFLASRVNFGVAQYHPDTHRADLNVQIDERRKIDIKITGAKLSLIPFLASRQQKKLLPFYEEGSVDLDLFEEGRRNLINYFQGKGYFDATVRTSVQRQPEQISLVYDVVKGKRHKVAEIVFRGNRNIDSDVLMEQVAVKKGRFFLSRGKYNSKLVAKSTSALKAFYQNRGYEDVDVVSQVQPSSSNIKIVFDITEGVQTKVADVKIQGTHQVSLRDAHVPSNFHIREGGPFSPGGVSKDRGQILAVYLDQGYLAADVKTQISRHQDDPHLVDVSFDVSEGQKIKISEVTVVGAPHTKRSLINRSANLWAEAPLSQTSLLDAESKLYNESIFDYASVGPRRPIADQTDEMVVLKLHEAKRNSLTYGFGLEVTRRGGNVPTGTIAIPGLPPVGTGGAKVLPSEKTFASPRGSIEFIRRNVRGLGETATVSLLAARLRQRAVATYADPHFRGSSWRSLLSISAERTSENPLFTANLTNGSLQFERTLDRAQTTTAQVRYSFGHTSLGHLIIPDLVLPEDQNVRLSTLSGTVIRDTRDKPLDAHRGFFQTVDLGVTAEAIGASATFSRFLGQNAYYRPLPHGMVWANSVRLGLAEPFAGSRIPTSERFFSGGGTTLRGFPINGAGPQRNVAVCSNPADPATCSRIPVPVGGNMLFILNSELRFPIPIISNLGGVVFYDGGNVFDHINLHRFADLYTNTVGFGVRYNTPVGPVRFDIGRNLDPITGIRATQFFITLGQAF